MSEHSPQPWSLRHAPVSIGPGYNSHRAYVVAADGSDVTGTIHHADEITIYGTAETRRNRATFGSVFGEGEPFPYSANAEFIVRAVNSHEALVSALKDLERTATNLTRDWADLATDPLAEHAAAIQCARALIAELEASHV